MNNIDKLLEDICIRHACKNIDKYVADIEQSLDIKLELGNQKYEYAYFEKFRWYSDARDKRDLILDIDKRQKMFSLVKIDIDKYYHTLDAKFKFHPENAA